MPCQGPVHLRRATVADAAGIANVYVAGWQEAHAGRRAGGSTPRCMRARSREDFWRDELAVKAPDREALGGAHRRRASWASRAAACRGTMTPIQDWARSTRSTSSPPAGLAASGRSLLRHVVRDLHDHGFERGALWVVAGQRCRDRLRREARLARRRLHAPRGLRRGAGRAGALPAHPALVGGHRTRRSSQSAAPRGEHRAPASAPAPWPHRRDSTGAARASPPAHQEHAVLARSIARETDLDPLVACRGHAPAHEVGADGQLAMAAVDEDGEPDRRRPAAVHRAHRAQPAPCGR